MAKKETTTELAEVKNNALSAIPSFISAEELGAGFEGTDKDSYAIPFLQILQKMSPMVDEDSPKYVEGAKAGMLYNTVTGRLFDGKAGLQFIPCAYKRSFIQWGARDNGGGFKGEFTPEQVEEMKAEGKLVLVDNKLYVPDADGKVDEKKSDYVADTRSHFIITIDPDNGETSCAILSCASSQIKASRNLMTSLNQKKIDAGGGRRATPPTYANIGLITTIGLSNDSGSWSGIVFKLEGLVSDADLFGEARDLYKSINSGELKADYSKVDAETTGSEGVGKPAEADNF